MNQLQRCLIAALLATQIVHGESQGSAAGATRDALSQFRGNGVDDVDESLAQDIDKRARLSPKFVGKRTLYIPDDDILDADAFPNLAEDSGDGSDIFSRQTRFAPRFVGRRSGGPISYTRDYRWAPKFVGKRRSPLFIGKRRSPYFVGKRADMSEGSALNSMYVDKRSFMQPKFIGRRSSGVPFIVGRREPSGDLDSAIFLGKRKHNNKRNGDQQWFTESNVKPSLNNYVIKNKYINKMQLSPPSFMLSTETEQPLEQAGDDQEKIKNYIEEGDVKILDTEKRQWDTDFIGKRMSVFSIPLGSKNPLKEYPKKRQVELDYIDKWMWSNAVDGKYDFPYNAKSKRQWLDDFTTKRGWTNDFIGKRGWANVFLGKRAWVPDFVGKRDKEIDIGKSVLYDDITDKQVLANEFNGKQALPRDFRKTELLKGLDKFNKMLYQVSKRQWATDFIGKRHFNDKKSRNHKEKIGFEYKPYLQLFYPIESKIKNGKSKWKTWSVEKRGLIENSFKENLNTYHLSGQNKKNNNISNAVFLHTEYIPQQLVTDSASDVIKIFSLISFLQNEAMLLRSRAQNDRRGFSILPEGKQSLKSKRKTHNPPLLNYQTLPERSGKNRWYGSVSTTKKPMSATGNVSRENILNHVLYKKLSAKFKDAEDVNKAPVASLQGLDQIALPEAWLWNQNKRDVMISNKMHSLLSIYDLKKNVESRHDMLSQENPFDSLEQPTVYNIEDFFERGNVIYKPEPPKPKEFAIASDVSKIEVK